MKKLVYIFSLLLLACACNLQDFEPQTSQDADKVEISFSVSVPESQSMTRAMSDNPALESMHAIVFDHNGFFVECVEAKLAESKDTDYTFNIALKKSDRARRIHFVGNCPKTPESGMESEVMADLQTTYPGDAYWYRVVVPNIHTDSDFGKIVLTRNYAKVVVEAAPGSGFTLESYAVAGTPTVGTVAPYNRNTYKFQDNYVDLDFEGLQSEDVDYNAFVPIDASPNFDLEYLTKQLALSPGLARYVYERETPISNPAYVIVKGTYKGSTGYYKIDLRDENGDYFPILRNFQYKITIKSVTRKGMNSIVKAMDGPGSGDVSSAVEYKSFTNISDGSARLFVDYTSKVLVSNEEVDLKVKFIGLGETVKLTEPPTITINEDSGISGDAIEYAVLPNENKENGWYTFKIKPVEVGDNDPTKTQSVTVTGKYTINGEVKTISRKVHFSLMPPRTMKVVCDPDAIPDIKESAFDVRVTIDDGLPQAMFPLSFKIEAENLTITPDNNDSMPVESGKSTIPGSNKKSSFWFVKTLSYKEYSDSELNTVKGERTFSCNFKSNTENSATKIFVSNEYFKQAECFLDNYHLPVFKDLAFDKENYSVTKGIPVNFTFTYEDSVVPVSIKLTNLASNDNRLADADNDGVFVFEHTPNKKTQTISLKTDSWGSKIGVEIVAAEGYNVPVSVTADRTLTATVSTGASRGTEIYYSFDDSLNTSSAIGSQSASGRNGNITISLSGDLGDGTRKVYFWYQGWWNTYSASTTLKALADGTATLNFQKQ